MEKLQPNGYIGIRLDNTLKEMLDDEAWRRRTTVSGLIRRIITPEAILRLRDHDMPVVGPDAEGEEIAPNRASAGIGG
jgi:hypothetical protein